jgi:hypothetical protein
MRTLKGKLIHNPNWAGAADRHCYLKLKQGDVFALLDKEELQLWGNIQLTPSCDWSRHNEKKGEMYWLGDTPNTRKERAIRDIEEDFSKLVYQPLKLELQWYLKDKQEETKSILFNPTNSYPVNEKGKELANTKSNPYNILTPLWKAYQLFQQG